MFTPTASQSKDGNGNRDWRNGVTVELYGDDVVFEETTLRAANVISSEAESLGGADGLYG